MFVAFPAQLRILQAQILEKSRMENVKCTLPVNPNRLCIRWRSLAAISSKMNTLHSCFVLARVSVTHNSEMMRWPLLLSSYGKCIIKYKFVLLPP
jgi:hypothetical protein